MKISLKIFFLIIPILAISCKNSAAEKIDMETLSKSKYEKSNIKLNESYQKLSKYSPVIIKKNIKNKSIYYQNQTKKNPTT